MEDDKKPEEEEFYIQRIESNVLERATPEQVDAAVEGFVDRRTMSLEEYRAKFKADPEKE